MMKSSRTTRGTLRLAFCLIMINQQLVLAQQTKPSKSTWQVVTGGPTNGPTFSVEMPSKPKKVEQGAAGSTLHTQLLDQESGTFALAWVDDDLPPERKKLSEDKLLNDSCDGSVAKSGGTEVSRKNIKFEGLTGKELIIDLKGQEARLINHIFLTKDKRLVMVLCGGKGFTTDHPDVKKFYASLKLTKGSAKSSKSTTPVMSADGWQEFKGGPEGGPTISINMPGKPTKQNRETPAGGMTLLQCQQSNGVYLVGWFDDKLPAERAKLSDEQLLNDACDGSVAQSKGEEISRESIKQDGINGKRLVMNIPALQGHMISHTYVTKDRKLIVLVCGGKGFDVNHPNVKKYFESLKLVTEKE